MSVNKVILIGNVGRDVETRYIDNGVARSTFTLATSESYLSKSGERVTTTDWHNIVAWRGLAEFASKYIKKGRKLYIEGRIKSRSYDGKDGVKHYVTEIYADSIQLLDKWEESDSEQKNAQNTGFQKPLPEESLVNDGNIEAPSDDLPF